MQLRTAGLVLLAPFAFSCSSPTAPVTPCEEAVQLSVSLDVTPARISWSPRCGAAVLTVHGVPNIGFAPVSWRIRSVDGRLASPIRYGVVPAGAVEEVSAHGGTRPPNLTALSLVSVDGALLGSCWVEQDSAFCD